MNRLGLVLISLVLGCGGSNAGSVFDEDGGSGGDTATSGDDTTPSGDAGADTTPGEEDSVAPPVDTGGPPPIDSGVDTGPTVPDVSVPDTSTMPCTEPGAKTFGGHCYIPIGFRTYNTARDFCGTLKAHLVTITSAAEQEFVRGVGFNDRWIGLTRAEGSPPGPGSFKWITGEAVSFTFWDMGEPNGSGFCTRMRDSDGRWADYQCSQSLAAVCERE